MTLPWACWINGAICPPEAATISPWASDFQHGLGAFETVRLTIDGPFALTRHLNRLTRSAELLALAQPPAAVIREAAWQVYREALPRLRQQHHDHPDQHTVARLRITWSKPATDEPAAKHKTGKHSPTTAGDPETPGNLVVQAQAAPRRNPTATVATCNYIHNEKSAISGAKTLSYGHNMQLMRLAARTRVDELILSNTANNLCECAASNIFLAVGDELITPPVSDGALPGIARELLILWADAAGLPVRERSIPAEALDQAEGLAISSSLRQFQPVTNLNGRSVPIPEIIASARSLFADQSRLNIDP